MGQIHERKCRTAGIQATDRALEEICGSGIKIGAASIGNRQEFEVVVALLDSAAEAIAAIRDPRIGDRRPRHSAIYALPDPAIHRRPIRTQGDVPGVHFSPGYGRKLLILCVFDSSYVSNRHLP